MQAIPRRNQNQFVGLRDAWIWILVIIKELPVWFAVVMGLVYQAQG